MNYKNMIIGALPFFLIIGSFLFWLIFNSIRSSTNAIALILFLVILFIFIVLWENYWFSKDDNADKQRGMPCIV